MAAGTIAKRTQLICPKCGCEDVTVWGEELVWASRDPIRERHKVTRVRCDICKYQGPTNSFFRVRLTRNGMPAVRAEVQYTRAGKSYTGELRAVRLGVATKEYRFVGSRGGEHIEVWTFRNELTLL